MIDLPRKKWCAILSLFSLHHSFLHAHKPVSFFHRRILFISNSFVLHRFRLGGEAFPPVVLYKIFCHGPLIDIGSFAPRDYTQARRKKNLNGDNSEQTGWYQRVENNGWRLVSEKLFAGREINSESKASRPILFHYSKVKRRQEVQKIRKQKKLDWMRKLCGKN